jgi:glutamate/tyrosine decarboxylase-like PLP-dependent enzyme
LKVWAAIARLGRAGVAELVSRCNALAKSLERQVLASEDFELLSPASLSVVNFRYRPAGRTLDDAALDDLNDKISEAISASGEAHIPTTRVHGKTALRVCFLHYENDEGDVAHLLGIARRIGRSLKA